MCETKLKPYMICKLPRLVINEGNFFLVMLKAWKRRDSALLLLDFLISDRFFYQLRIRCRRIGENRENLD